MKLVLAEAGRTYAFQNYQWDSLSTRIFRANLSHPSVEQKSCSEQATPFFAGLIKTYHEVLPPLIS
jgi:hypothetical protein